MQVKPFLRPKRNRDYKTPINKILVSSSLAFLLNPIRSNHILIKIVWTFFLIVFVFANVYYVVLSVLDYLNYDTITSIYQINENEAEFPTVSFCSEFEKNFEISFSGFWFNNQRLENDWKNHLDIYTDTYYGKCYRFNSGKNMLNKSIPIKYSKRSGNFDGFSMSFYSNTSKDYGSVVVSIHNRTQIPSSIFNQETYVSAGSYNFFIIKRIYDQKLDHPYNDCYKNVSLSVIHNKTLINYIKNKTNWEYTQNKCILLCKNLIFNETNNCSCSLNSLDDEINNRCNLTKKPCIDEFMNDYNQDLCFNSYCPLECDSFTYDITLKTQSRIAYGNISKNAKHSGYKTYENYTKTFYGIRIYYEELKYTLISQQSKIELFGLISNIGGTLGLFLGFSFVSFLEIFEIFAELVYICFIYK